MTDGHVIRPTTALILAGGMLPTPALWPALLEGCGAVIAADGGLAHARVLRVTPDLVVGDLDSVEPSLLERYPNVPIERHRADKDQLDLELALEAAWSRGATGVRVAGAVGGRLDQTLAALLIAARAASTGREVVLYGGRYEARSAVTGSSIVRELPGGTTVSLLALQEGCRVSIGGVRYPLHAADLPWGSGLGVSNEAAGGAVRLDVLSGTVALLIEHPEEDPRAAIWGAQSERIGAALAAADPDLAALIEGFVYTDMFSRPGLDLATRELLAVALLTSLGATEELTTHLRGALRTGATERQVREAILHAAVFVGFPRALAAMRVLGQYLDDRPRRS